MARIHIFGASGSGTTTLGQALSARLQIPHLDSDRYFWMPTNPPFVDKRPEPERQEMLLRDMASLHAWVSTGSLCGWGDVAIPLFDLAVFLWIPPDLRMARLEAREIERYGAETVRPGGVWSKPSQEFLDWAAEYDTGGLDMRSRARHESWMSDLPCGLLRIEGDTSVEERVARVLSALQGSILGK